MRVFKRIAVSICMSLIAATSYASGEKGNGGVGSGKFGIGGELDRAEMLDYFEATNGLFVVDYAYRTVYTFTQPETEQSAIDAAVKRAELNPAFSRIFKDSLNRIQGGKYFLPDGIEPEPSLDAFPKYKREGWDWIQIANADESGYHLAISKKRFEKLDTLNRAMLIVHEAVYLAARRLRGDSDSVRSRAITAMLMADNFEAYDLQMLTHQLAPMKKLPELPKSKETPLIERCDKKVEFFVEISNGDAKMHKKLEVRLLGEGKLKKSVANLVQTSGQKTSARLELSCEEVRKFKNFAWMTYARGGASPRETEYTLEIVVDGQSLFKLTKPFYELDYGGFQISYSQKN